MINGTQNPALPREHEEAAPAADTSRQHDRALCPTWCTGAHPDTSFDHRSAPLGMFTATHAETETPEPGTVYTGAFRDEVTVERRKVVLEVPRDCFGWTWLDAEQARRVAGFLVAAAEQLEADRG